MKYLDWSSEKNERLKFEREICFEDVVLAIDNNQILDIIQHKNLKKYPNQKILIVKIENYAFLVPFVEDDTKIFFKTIIPSRQATKKYIINPK